MERKKIQLFFLKSGNSANDQPNVNGLNTNLKSYYNEVNFEWMLKYDQVLSCHMNSILVEA